MGRNMLAFGKPLSKATRQGAHRRALTLALQAGTSFRGPLAPLEQGTARYARDRALALALQAGASFRGALGPLTQGTARLAHDRTLTLALRAGASFHKLWSSREVQQQTVYGRRLLKERLRRRVRRAAWNGAVVRAVESAGVGPMSLLLTSAFIGKVVAKQLVEWKPDGGWPMSVAEATAARLRPWRKRGYTGFTIQQLAKRLAHPKHVAQDPNMVLEEVLLCPAYSTDTLSDVPSRLYAGPEAADVCIPLGMASAVVGETAGIERWRRSGGGPTGVSLNKAGGGQVSGHTLRECRAGRGPTSAGTYFLLFSQPRRPADMPDLPPLMQRVDVRVSVATTAGRVGGGDPVFMPLPGGMPALVAFGQKSAEEQIRLITQ
jgi:hypothetical protein